MTAPITVGGIFARVSYGTVVAAAENNGNLTVRNTEGFEWTIGRAIVEREFCFAGAFTETEKVPVSRIERIFKEGVGSNVFKVTFAKKPDVDAGVDAITASDWASLNKTKRRKVVRSVLAGEPRTLIGRLDVDAYKTATAEPETLGRMKVIDLQISDGARNERLIDLRTVTELIVGGVRYVVG